MKRLFIVHFTVLLFAFTSTAQSPCSKAKVVSPVVPKPTNGSIVSATCSNLVVQWQGAANQSYTANVSSYNAATNKWDTAYAIGTCNSSQICMATLPVSAGSKVNWSVQAEQVINGRTFFSYYFIGERDYAIPACTPAVITQAVPETKGVPEIVASKDQLLVYPNPATSEITIQWSGAYKGAAVVTISDAGGKEVRLLRIAKEAAVYTNRIPVGNLVAGLYYVQVKPQGGQPLAGKFLKQ